MDWRIIAVIVILTLGVIDLVATYYYVHTYKQWQPDKPYKLIEMNPLLVFLWNKMGLVIGMVVGAIVILTLQFIIAREAHWAIVIILGLFLLWAEYNHFTNIGLLTKLIEQYPSGHLPIETFGKVVGNNLN